MNAERAFAAALLVISIYVSVLVIRPFFTYVALAVLLAYTLFPLQRQLSPRFEAYLGSHLGPRASALVLMVAATVLFVLPFVLLLRVVVQQALAVVEGIQSGAIDVRFVREFFESDLGQRVVAAAQSGVGEVLQGTVGVLGGASNVAIGITVLGFLLYYLLVGGESIVAWFRKVTPLAHHVQDELIADLDRLTYAVLITAGVIAVVQAVLTGIALAVLGFSNVIFWTVVAVVLGILPFVGSMFIWGPAGIYLLATGSILPGAGLLLYGFGVVNLTDNYLRPVIGGRSANLNPGILILGIFGGLAVFGFTGIFVGPIVLGFTRTLAVVVAREYA